MLVLSRTIFVVVPFLFTKYFHHTFSSGYTLCSQQSATKGQPTNCLFLQLFLVLTTELLAHFKGNSENAGKVLKIWKSGTLDYSGP